MESMVFELSEGGWVQQGFVRNLESIDFSMLGTAL